MERPLTVVICTYNRPDLLSGTLASLGEQSLSRAYFDLVLVDNYGQEVVRQLADRHHARYYFEPNTGLSFARNLGWKKSKTPWVLYLDDDIKAPNDLLQKLYGRIATAEFDGVGGWYRYWFTTPPPPWLMRYYDLGRWPNRQQTSFGELIPPYVLSGCLMCLRRSALETLGGFATNYGMQGNKIAYGEDDEIQHRLRGHNYRIFYDPELYIDHAVQLYKYKLTSRIKMQYASGRDSGWQLPPIKRSWLYAAYRIGRVTLLTLPRKVFLWANNQNYYWQNLFVDVLGEYAYVTGLLRSRSKNPDDGRPR